MHWGFEIRAVVTALAIACLIAEPRPAAAEPSWVSAPAAQDDDWSYAAACAGDEAKAVHEALVTLAGFIETRIETRTRARFDELLTPDVQSFTDRYAFEAQSTSQAWFHEHRVVARHRRADGSTCVRVRVARKGPLDAQVRAVAETIAPKLSKGARVVVLPPFKRNGVTSALGAHIAMRLGHELRTQMPTLREVQPRRPVRGKQSLDSMLAGADVLVYGIVEQFPDRLTVGFEALDARRLDQVIASARLELRAMGEALLLANSRLSRISDAASPLLMRAGTVARQPLQVEVQLDPPRPRDGDAVRIRVRTDQAAWVSILSLEGGDEVMVLAPNPDWPRVRTEPGIWRSLPEPDGPQLQVKRAPQHSESRLKVVATAATGPAAHFDVSDFPVGWSDSADGGPLLRLLERIENLALADVAWGTAELTYAVEEGPAPWMP